MCRWSTVPSMFTFGRYVRNSTNMLNTSKQSKVLDTGCDTDCNHEVKIEVTKYVSAPTNAEEGIVRIHAMIMLPATPHRTPESRFVAPTPMIAPVMVCVVLTGIPPHAVIKSVRPPAASALNPPVGLSFVIFCPIVF